MRWLRKLFRCALRLRDLDLGQLQARAMITDKVAREARAKGDDRWHEAARQHRLIMRAIVEKKRQLRKQRGEPEPPQQFIGMHPVAMKSRRVRIGT